MSQPAKQDINPAKDPDLKLKLKLVEIDNIENSELPYRVFKRASGAPLKTCATMSEVVEFLRTVTVDYLKAKPTRRRVKSH